MGKIIYSRNSLNTYSIEGVFELLKPKFQELMQDLVWVKAPVEGNSWSNRWRIVLHCAKLPAGVLHLTGDIYYAVLFRGLFNKKSYPIVLTIHDLEVLKRNNGLKRWLIRLLWFELPIRRAQIVTVISNETRLDVEREFRVHPDKIKVIYNPLDACIETIPLEKAIPNRLLAIGTKDNKNLPRVLEALQGLPIELVLIGKCSKALQQAINDSGVPIIQKHSLSKEELLHEYALCNALIFASTIEGFGMPILEAQAIGRPVITSNCSSMPEVAGDGAEFVDPYAVESIRKGVLYVLESKERQQELIRLGLENCKRFDANTIAHQYAEVYESLES